MTIAMRTARVAARLTLVRRVTLLFRAATVAALIVVAAAALDAIVELPLALRLAVTPFAALAALALLWSRRDAWRAVRLERAALWLEERSPELRWRLVTCLDPRYATAFPEVEREVSALPFDQGLSAALGRTLRASTALFLAAVLGAVVLPDGTIARVARAGPGDALRRPVAGPVRDPLRTIVVRVSPPAYVASETATLDDPASVRALVGSRVVIDGRIGDDSVVGVLDSVRLGSRATDGQWRLATTMPEHPIIVRLVAGTHERLLALDPVPDSAPVVTLTTPARDSILRRAAGSIPLHADVADDHGLAGASFEYIVSSGSGETFTFRSGTLGVARLAGARGALDATLRLEALGLAPGDLVHLRAVARDRNDLSGPTLGVSETRTLRVARADEYDSVAVDAAPPPEPEKDALSQRMLLMMARSLERQRARMLRTPFVAESRTIAVEQTRLRKRVGEIVFQRLGEREAEEGDALARRLDRPTNPDSVLAAAERATNAGVGTALEGDGDESPVVAVNRPLLEAYNFMWSASTELELGEPRRAIPWMQRALDRLQAARAAERIYLRGKVRAVIVDIPKVRLAGKEKGSSTVRATRTESDPTRGARLARFDRALNLAATRPTAAADSLVLLRIELVARDPVAADALDRAARRLRSGGEATDALLAARRTLSARIERVTGLGLWSVP